MNLVDQRYHINLLSSRLKLFKQTSKDLWNCRCPSCGDSKKSETSRHFYIYRKGDSYSVKCHRCGYSAKFPTFYRNIFPDVYETNILNKYKKRPKQRRRVPVQSSTKPSLNIFTNNGYSYSSLTQLCELPTTHPAIVELKRRKIHEKWWVKHILYCEDFNKFLIKIGERKQAQKWKKYNEPRLILPFYDSNGDSNVFQGRSLAKKTKLRYFTCKRREKDQKVWGLDRIDPGKPVFVFEGAFDAMFVRQAIAMSGSMLKMEDNLLKIYVLDNEQRNEEICKINEKLLRRGESIVVWPEGIKEKDVNDMILAGMTEKKLTKILNENIVRGTIGMMKLNKWRKDK